MPETPDLHDLPVFAAPTTTRRPPLAPQTPATPAVSPFAATALAGGGSGPMRRPRGHTAPPPEVPFVPRNPDAPRYQAAEIDWDLVRALRQQASTQLAEQLRERQGIDEAERRALGTQIISALVQDHSRSDTFEGRALIDRPAQADLRQAVFDSLFRLGRLQPLMDLPDVENIEITGHDHVLLMYADGGRQLAPPVADSDEELVEFLAFLAARRDGAGERSFSSANPRLHLPLEGRARLAALMGVTPRPVVRIRKHRHTDVDLAQLRRLGMLDETLEAFLTAAVRARKSIVVSGAQGSGKTTLVRALAAAIDPWESVGTLETEFELFLHEDKTRHPRCIPVEARPGSGELRPDGHRAGAITLEDLLEDMLRYNLDRIIVGEVRGPEAMAMFKAMQAGAGGICTTHSTNARDTIERLVTCVLSVHSNEAYASRLVAQHVDVIVHLSAEADPVTGMRRRVVSEVIEVGTGEGHRAAVTDLFRPGPDGVAIPVTPPSWLPTLERFGFDGALLRTPWSDR